MPTLRAVEFGKFIILCRHPNGKVVAIEDYDEHDQSEIAVFPSYGTALVAAGRTRLCEIAEYQIIELEI